MKKMKKENRELKYEAGLVRVEYIGIYRGPSVIEINTGKDPFGRFLPNIKIDGKVFEYFEQGDKELGIEIRSALGKLEEILKQIVKHSRGKGNFKITFTKYVPKR